MRQGAERSRLDQTAIAVSTYLARWHQAFAVTPGGAGPVVELWFDRGEERPLCERVRLPRRLDAGALRVASLYLAALINNKLCVWGARRVSLVADEASLAKELLQRVSSSLLYRGELFSDLTPLFILALIEQCHGAPLVLDYGPGSRGRAFGAALPAMPHATVRRPWPPPGRADGRERVNIGPAQDRLGARSFWTEAGELWNLFRTAPGNLALVPPPAACPSWPTRFLAGKIAQALGPASVRNGGPLP